MNQVLPRMNRDDGDFIPPSDRFISSLDGTYYKPSEVAVLVGKSEVTIRRLLKNPNIKAPSYEGHQGKNRYYLYTPEDVEEIKAYYEKEAQVIPRNDDQDPEEG